MADQRQELHAQVEQIVEEDIDFLVSLINRFLHPLESPASKRIVFERVPPGTKAAAELEAQRQQVLAQHRAKQLDMIKRSFGDATERLDIDLDTVVQGLRSWSASGLKSEQATCSWFEGRVFHRLSTYHVKEQRVFTFERCHFPEGQSELIYKVRILTSTAAMEKELAVPA